MSFRQLWKSQLYLLSLKYPVLKSIIKELKRTSLKLEDNGRILKGLAVTTASAATGALFYLSSLKPNDQDELLKQLKKYGFDQGWNNLTSFVNTKLEQFEKEQENDEISMFLGIGYVEDWLACPILPSVLQSKKVYESSAFIKPNIVELLSPWEQSSSDDPWVLLHLTRSGNFWVRQMGVACLANKLDWESYKYRNVAQACDYRTVIGLARYNQANDAFFLPQPKLYTSNKDLLTEVQNLVMGLPNPQSLKTNIAFYRSLALQKEILFQNDPLAMDVLTNFYTVPGEDEKKIDQLLRYSLQALEAYTAEERYACLFVKHKGLATLQRLHEENKEDWVQTYVLSILNNLSHVVELGKELVQSGWIKELRAWCKSSNTTFSTLADTVLANLDRDWISNVFYKNMILLHPTQRNSLPAHADIVLVHGLRGGAVKTWRQRDDTETEEASSDCWPKDWMPDEFQNTRIISIGYNSTLHQWGDQTSHESEKESLEGRSKELVQHLIKAGVGMRPIIWMGHSMGGLLIKEMLALSEKTPSVKCILNSTKGIVMYSVPHRGSHIVDTMMYAKYLLFPSIEVQEMSTYSPKLKDLHETFVRLVSSYFIPCLSFGENVKTDIGGPLPSVLLVSKESSDPGIGQFNCLETNHIDVCKPCDKDDPMYQDTLHFLRNILRHLQHHPKCDVTTPQTQNKN